MYRVSSSVLKSSLDKTKSVNNFLFQIFCWNKTFPKNDLGNKTNENLATKLSHMHRARILFLCTLFTSYLQG